MRLYMISLLPLAGAAVVALLDRRPLYGLGITLLVILVCTGLVVGLLPMEGESALYGWDFALDYMARPILLWMYWGTALLCLCAVVVGRTTTYKMARFRNLYFASAYQGPRTECDMPSVNRGLGMRCLSKLFDNVLVKTR